MKLKLGGKRIAELLRRKVSDVSSSYTKAKGAKKEEIMKASRTITIFSSDICTLGYDSVENLTEQVQQGNRALVAKENELNRLREQIIELRQQCNHGKQIDQMSRRQKTRKLNEWKTIAEKALWFSESFGLNIDSITAHTSNTGESITLSLGSSSHHPGQESDSATNGSSTSSASSPAAVDEDSLEATLYLLERFGVSDESYHELTQVCCMWSIIKFLSLLIANYHCFSSIVVP